MGSYEIRTDILRDVEIVREFKGHHPSKLLGTVLSDMIQIFKCQSSDSFYDKLKWDISNSKDTQFYGEWRVREKKDNLTYLWCYVKVHGYQNPVTKNGKVNVRIKSILITKLKYVTLFDLALWYIYYKMIYMRQTRDYVKIALERVDELDNKIKKVVGEKKTPPGSSNDLPSGLRG